MFFEVANASGQLEFINSDQITKVFDHHESTRINLTDGFYVITYLSPEDVMELIHAEE